MKTIPSSMSRAVPGGTSGRAGPPACKVCAQSICTISPELSLGYLSVFEERTLYWSDLRPLIKLVRGGYSTEFFITLLKTTPLMRFLPHFLYIECMIILFTGCSFSCTCLLSPTSYICMIFPWKTPKYMLYHPNSTQHKAWSFPYPTALYLEMLGIKTQGLTHRRHVLNHCLHSHPFPKTTLTLTSVLARFTFPA